MPRKKLLRQSEVPYHVFNRVISKDFYPENNMDKVWGIYCDAARTVSWAFGAQIHALVLMSNHYHMLISTPSNNLDSILMYFQSDISRRVTKMVEDQKYRFQSRYKWVLVRNAVEYIRTFRYIAFNPVEAGITSCPFSYRYSSIAFQHGEARDCCPLFPSHMHKNAIDLVIKEVRYSQTHQNSQHTLDGSKIPGRHNPLTFLG